MGKEKVVIREGLAEFGLTESHHSRITIKPLFRFDLIVDAYPCLFLSWMRRFL
jgi:hypothetical protein